MKYFLSSAVAILSLNATVLANAHPSQPQVFPCNGNHEMCNGGSPSNQLSPSVPVTAMPAHQRSIAHRSARQLATPFSTEQIPNNIANIIENRIMPSAEDIAIMKSQGLGAFITRQKNGKRYALSPSTKALQPLEGVINIPDTLKKPNPDPAVSVVYKNPKLSLATQVYARKAAVTKDGKSGKPKTRREIVARSADAVYSINFEERGAEPESYFEDDAYLSERDAYFDEDNDLFARDAEPEAFFDHDKWENFME